MASLPILRYLRLTLPSDAAPSAKLRVENLHYELTEEDLEVRHTHYWSLGSRSYELQDLFNRIGPVLKLDLLYDRSGRSDGVAYVTYESHYDAKKAIREFDGANAKGTFRSPNAPNQANASQGNPYVWSLFPLVPQEAVEIPSILSSCPAARWKTASRFLKDEAVPIPPSVIQTSVAHLPAMLTVTSQAEVAVPEVHHAEETVDVLVRDESVERDQDVVVVVVKRCLEMEDRRRHKRSSMLKWKIIGVGKRMELALTHLLKLLPL